MALTYDQILQIINAPRPDEIFEPDWRWNRIARLAERLPALPMCMRSSHGLIYQTFHFYRRFMGLTPQAVDHDQLRAEYPGLFKAVTFATDSRALETKWMLEAYVMTNEPPASIAKRYPVPPEIIDLYELLFFDVRDYLTFRSFVLTTMLGPLVEGRVSKDRDLTRKLIAYLGGADMLMRFIDLSDDFTPAEWTWLQRAVRKGVTVNAVRATTSTEINKYNCVDVVDLHSRFERNLMEMSTVGSLAGSGTGGGGASQFVHAIVASLQGFVGDKRTMDPVPTDRPFEEYPADAKLLMASQMP